MGRKLDRLPTDREGLLAIALPLHQGVDVGSLAVGLILPDGTKDHKPLVLGLAFIKLKGNLLGTIVGKAEGLGFCTRAKDRESLCGRFDIQLDGLPSVGR